MNKRLIFTTALLTLSVAVMAQAEPNNGGVKPASAPSWGPQPEVVTPGNFDNMIIAPSDAIALFDGADLSQWVGIDGQTPQWDIEGGILYTTPQMGAISTKQGFSDCQLHVEWMIPKGTEGKGQGKGNSGVFLQSRYEVQVLDSYNNQTYPDGQAGSIYRQHPPLVNACQEQGRWNSYDIIYTAPTYRENGTIRTYPRMTVLHNGVLVQNNEIVTGVTKGGKDISKNKTNEKLPLMLQDHRNRIAFRNIWIREL